MCPQICDMMILQKIGKLPEIYPVNAANITIKFGASISSFNGILHLYYAHVVAGEICSIWFCSVTSAILDFSADGGRED